ncbi:hypothetical protein B0H19DRAFT_1251917 [Mycena capillaripes]|nr:hypothetical protein B0H19DRAFT_1251917 [Mycena capillaripes]
MPSRPLCLGPRSANKTGNEKKKETNANANKTASASHVNPQHSPHPSLVQPPASLRIHPQHNNFKANSTRPSSPCTSRPLLRNSRPTICRLRLAERASTHLRTLSTRPQQQPPPPCEPLEHVFRVWRTISPGTFVLQRTPFPYVFPPPSLRLRPRDAHTAPKSSTSPSKQDPDLLAPRARDAARKGRRNKRRGGHKRERERERCYHPPRRTCTPTFMCTRPLTLTFPPPCRIFLHPPRIFLPPPSCIPPPPHNSNSNFSLSNPKVNEEINPHSNANPTLTQPSPPPPAASTPTMCTPSSLPYTLGS